MTDKGYGFIKRNSGDKDLFFHSSQLRGIEFNDLQSGDHVEFGIDTGEKGLFATEVRVLR